jgi:hypothetical protein
MAAGIVAAVLLAIMVALFIAGYRLGPDRRRNPSIRVSGGTR